MILRFDELRPGEASPVNGFPGAERGKLWRADDEKCMEGSDGLREQESLRIFLPEYEIPPWLRTRCTIPSRGIL